MPSVSVSLSDAEYMEVSRQAKKEKKSPGTYIAEIVRVTLKEGAVSEGGFHFGQWHEPPHRSNGADGAG